MERLLEMGVSPTNLDKLVGGLSKAETLELRLNGLEEDDTEEDVSCGLHITMVSKDRDGKEEIETIKIPLVANADGDELSEDSEEFIIHTLCPYMCNMSNNVRALEICFCRPRIRSVLKCFRENKLQSLVLLDCDNILEEADIQQVKGTFKHLKNFEMDNRYGGHHLGVETQTSLVEALAETKSLLKFTLVGVSLNQACFRGLLERLTLNQNLKVLALESGCLQNQSSENLQKLGRMVALLPCLEEVEIGYNRLGDSKCSAFLTELGQMTGPPIKLEMYQTGMGIGSFRVLGRILSTRDAILALHFSNLSDDGAVILFDSLRGNTSLLEFKSSRFLTSIGRLGAAAMMTMLERNETITSIRIETGALSDEGLGMILSGLERNVAVTDFYLSSNSLGLLAYESLSRVISQNSVVRDLSVWQGRIITRAMASAISNVFSNNTTLESFSICSLDGFEKYATDILVNGLKSSTSITSWASGIDNFREVFSSQQEEILNHHFPLNRFGRKYLIDPNLPLELYPWILAKAAKDIEEGKSPKWGLDVLYDVVRNRPEVYDVNPRRSHVTRKRKARDASIE